MTTLLDFFHKHGFSSAPNAHELLAEFDRQMDAGLDGTHPASLAMIPAYVSMERAVPVAAPVLVLDAGGTNLRAAVIWFDEHGTPRIEDFQKYRMPGTEGIDLSAAAFFDALAERLRPIIDRAGTIGFCFSYPAEITPDCDGRLLRWTKQVQASEVVGRLVGTGVAEAVQAKFGRDISVRIVNDTVATLLAGKSAGVARHYSSYVGFILGTGTNMAYVERTERIGKAHLPAGGRMAINVESGNFNGVEQSDFDREMDAALPDTGVGTFEKMISGAYLGRLGLVVLQTAAREGLFPAPAASRCRTSPTRISTTSWPTPSRPGRRSTPCRSTTTTAAASATSAPPCWFAPRASPQSISPPPSSAAARGMIRSTPSASPSTVRPTTRRSPCSSARASRPTFAPSSSRAASTTT